ncbi:unnamed protein product [Cyprideis torosa]|uniref:Uncharacterized protein n=1 Tax=Cyprideis torosa TaxID=163714 RepID=A0A7R8WEY2_9CRUS|nr:unnamed protein product [Cyprideis torosa]CAG0896191.1 unnamed protein product [Cyprideis torosa]
MASNFEPNVNPPTPPWSARDSSISQIESTGVNERKNGETSYNDGSLSLRTVDEEERPEISISPTFAATAPASVNGLQGISPLLLESASSEDLGEDGLVEASLDDEVENQLLSQRFHLDSPEDDERSSLYSGMSEGLEFKVADFMRKIADLENNLKKATDEKEELHNSLKSSREATATLMRECEKLRGEIDRLKAQNESASLAHQEKVTALHREVKRVRESSESMVLQYAQSEKELLLLGQAKDGVERKLKEMLREKESLVTRVRTLADEKSRLARNMDSKCAEASQLSRDLEKSKEELTARDVKLKWLQNKLVEEMEAHRQTQNDLKQTLGELQDARDETESVRRECQDALSRCREEAEDEKLAIHQQAEEAELVLKAREELGQAKARCQSLSQTNGQLEQKMWRSPVKMRRLLCWLTVILLMLGRCICSPPNLIMILMDDMGWGDLGSNGEPHRETPHLDRMAREGATLTDFYSAAPLCSPSRAALLTGRLPVRTGFFSDNAPGRNAYTPQEIVGGIPDSEVLLSEALKEYGYRTGVVGKWHLGHRPQFLPLRHGFDSWFGSPNCHLGPYDNRTLPNIPVFKDDRMVGRFWQPGEFDFSRPPSEEGQRLWLSNYTLRLVEEALEFVTRGKEGTPFFLLFTPDATHNPLYVSPRFLGLSNRGSYGDVVREMDWAVGQLLAALDRLGLSEDTLVVFGSDNGPALVSKCYAGSAGPFLCGKQTTFEGGMRSPGIALWKGRIRPGTTLRMPLTQMDVFPTFLEAAGVPVPSGVVLDGQSFLRELVWAMRLPIPLSMPIALLTNAIGDVPCRPVFLYRGDRLMAVRVGPYKAHLWTWTTPEGELRQGIDHCPGECRENLTTTTPTDHRRLPLLFHLNRDVGERFPIPPSTNEYSQAMKTIRQAVAVHEKGLVLGPPQLNWCDRSVMHWAPPGCEQLDACLPVPPPKPYKCSWPH